MPRLISDFRPASLRRVLATDRPARCASCGGPVQPLRPNVSVRGAWFHLHCATYRLGYAGDELDD